MELNERQQTLYEYMIGKGEVELIELARELYNYDYEEQIGEWRNRHSIGLIREDVISINRSSSQYKIAPIMQGRSLWGYKIANKAELEKLRDRYRRSGINKLIKARDIDIAIKNNGAMRINGNLDFVEIEAWIRDTVEELGKTNG